MVDASNLERNLYFASQVIELGYPTIIALNMVDVAQINGVSIDAAKLSGALGVPVIPIVASAGTGIKELQQQIVKCVRENRRRGIPPSFCELAPAFEAEIEGLTRLLGGQSAQRATSPQAEALLILCDEKFLAGSDGHYPPEIKKAVLAEQQRLETAPGWIGGARPLNHVTAASTPSIWRSPPKPQGSRNPSATSSTAS